MAELNSASLSPQIQAALKSGDAERLAVLRLLSVSLKNAETSKQGGELSDDEALAVVSKEVRRRMEAAEEFEKAGSPERAEQERAEAEILRAWLPEPLSGDELRQMVTEAIEEAGAEGQGDLGKVMKVLVPKVKGRADGKQVSEAVRSALAGN